jgi:CheY-like chemotaxis protein
VALVEDNADAREVLADVLTFNGHQVFTAADGPAALHLAQEQRAEVFVVDIGLPGMDGYQVARALRQMPGGDQLRLIALTGYGTPEEKERARAAGFDAHLTKPADIDELERLLAGTG